ARRRAASHHGLLVPDPVALAQGHRLMRAAVALEAPAWICGGAALLVLVMQCVALHQPKEFAVASTLMLGLAWMLWVSRRPPSMGATSPSPRVPGEIHDLLALVDSLVDTLERGKD